MILFTFLAAGSWPLAAILISLSHFVKASLECVAKLRDVQPGGESARFYMDMENHKNPCRLDLRTIWQSKQVFAIEKLFGIIILEDQFPKPD